MSRDCQVAEKLWKPQVLLQAAVNEMLAHQQNGTLRIVSILTLSWGLKIKRLEDGCIEYCKAEFVDKDYVQHPGFISLLQPDPLSDLLLLSVLLKTSVFILLT